MTLGINPTENKKDIKRAYAKLLKVTKPDNDPVAYQALREAFDWAIGYCDYMATRAHESEIVEHQADELQNLAQQEQIDDANVINDNSAFFPNRLPLEDDENTLNDPIITHEPQELGETHADDFIQEDPYQSATNLVARIFDADSEEQATDIFQSIIDSHDLLHLQTRAYFEKMCLNALLQSSQDKLHYELLESIGAEFLWFDEHQSNSTRANDINYLTRCIEEYKKYKLLIASQITSKDYAEQNVAELLVGSYKPKYFHLLRFIGTYNTRIRKKINYFKSVVNTNLCSELETDSFTWWDRNLARSMYSLWHCLVGILMGAIILFNIQAQITPDSALRELLIYIFLLVSISSSLGVWGVDTLYRRYSDPIKSRWDKVKNLSQTHIILICAYVLLTGVWNFNKELWYFAFIAIGLAVLLFGWRGVGLLFINFIVSTAIFADLTGELKDYAQHLIWILILISHKLFLQSMMKMPKKITDVLRKSDILLCVYQGIITAVLAYLYLFFLTASFTGITWH